MKNYKWKPKKLYQNIKEWDKSLSNLNKLIKKFEQISGSYSPNSTDILEILKLEKRIDSLAFKMFTYLTLRKEVEMKNTLLKDKEAELDSLWTFYNILVQNFEYSFEKLGAKGKRIRNQKKMEHFAPRIDKIINSSRRSSKKEDKILNDLNSLSEKFNNIYKNIIDNHLVFKDIKTDNSLKKVNFTNLNKNLTSSNKNIRKQTYFSKVKGFQKTGDSFVDTISGFLQANNIHSKTEKFKSSIEFTLKEDKIKEKQINSVLNTVLKNKDIINKFIGIKKKELNLSRYYEFDDNADIIDYKISAKKSIKYFYDSLKLFNNNSIEKVQTLIENGNLYLTSKPECHIPYAGYCYNLGVTDPYVFSYFKNDLHSAMTIAHEFGHAIHNIYMMENNDFWNSDTSLIIQETVAYVHELVFLKNLINKTTNKKEKKRLLCKLASYYYDVLYKKSINTKMEKFLYKKSESHKPFKLDSLNKKYNDILNDFKVKNSLLTSQAKYSWIGNQRLYWSFYEFKYIIAFAFASKITQGIMSQDEEIIEKFNLLMTKGDDEHTKTFFDLFNINYNNLGIITQDSFDELNNILTQIEEI